MRIFVEMWSHGYLNDCHLLFEDADSVSTEEINRAFREYVAGVVVYPGDQFKLIRG